MDEMRKAISTDDRLRALALFVMAKEHYEKSREFASAMARLLCVDDGCSHLDDALYNLCPFNIKDFEEALEREGIAVVEGES